MAAAKSKVIRVDMDKVDKCSQEIQEAVNKFLCQVSMIGAELVLALNKACYNVIDAWVEADEERVAIERNAAVSRVTNLEEP